MEYNQLKTLWWFQVDSKGLSHEYIWIHFPKLPSHPDLHIALSRVPRALQEALVGDPFQIQQCVHVNLKLHNYPFPQLSLPGNHKFIV